MTRVLCPRCERPPAACLCAFVTPVQNEVEILILQHPSEAREAKGTARLLQLSLTRCVLLCGESFEPPPEDGRQAWLLYPRDDVSAPLVTVPSPALPRAAEMRLIVLDGTWRKSRKLLHVNPWLLGLARYSLSESAVSAYAPLRRAHAPGQLSTLEATALALAEIESAAESGAGRYDPLLAGLQGFVDQSLRLAGRKKRTDEGQT